MWHNCQQRRQCNYVVVMGHVQLGGHLHFRWYAALRRGSCAPAAAAVVLPSFLWAEVLAAATCADPDRHDKYFVKRRG